MTRHAMGGRWAAGLALGAVLLVPQTGRAQAAQVESGLWVSAGAGYSSGSYSCDGCARDAGGLTGVLGAGWSPNDRVSVGIEIAGGRTSADGVTDLQGQGLLVFEGRPFAALGLYFGAGAGLARWATRIDYEGGAREQLLRNGFGYSARAGWLVSLSPHFSLQPQLAWVAVPEGAVGEAGLEAGQDLLRFDATVRWHWSGP